MRKILIALLAATPFCVGQALNAPRPIAAGKTTGIIGTGGVEQNGPYVAGGKHNYVLQLVLPYIAREIGNTLIARFVKFVPEGAIEPAPTGDRLYPGTISVAPATFEALLTDICNSYKTHGFIDIMLLGDSGGNQEGMKNVAKALNLRWQSTKARAHYLADYDEEALESGKALCDNL